MFPSMRALRAVEAAARHRSFTGAATELGLTHGAVAQQVRGLEADLGRRLFERQGHEMVPTSACAELATAIRQILATLDAALRQAGGRPSAGTLTISTLPAFATRWLIPRLPGFTNRYPDIDVAVRATQELEPPGRDGIVAAIRYGRGPWPGLTARRLFGEQLFPVCAPGFRNGRLPERPADLATLPLLRHQRQPWSPWFQAAGLHLPEPARGPLFSEMSLLLEAAAAGQGIALARAALVEGDLAGGRLVRLFDIDCPDQFAYHLVWRMAEDEDPRLAAFTAWLDEVTAGPSQDDRLHSDRSQGR